MSKSFNQFDVALLLREIDYLVGYKGDDEEEIRISGAVLESLFRGSSGSSVQIQFSVNGESWHYPAIENDEYVRFKSGLDPWSSALKIVGEKGDVGTGLSIQGTFDSLESLQEAVTHPTQGEMYNVGSAAPYHIYMWDTTSETWEDQGQLQGENGTPVVIEKDNTNIFWHYEGDDTKHVIVALSALKGDKGDPGNKGDKGDPGTGGSGLPSGFNPRDILFIGDDGNPIWLPGITRISIDSGMLGIGGYSQKFIVDFHGYSDIEVSVNNGVFNYLLDIDIIIFNRSSEDRYLYFTDGYIQWKEDTSIYQIRRYGFLEISLRPIMIDNSLIVRGIVG
jgi:hypothetical protein